MSSRARSLAEVVVGIAALVLRRAGFVGVVLFDFLLRRLAATEVLRFLVAVAAAVDVAHRDHLAVGLLQKPQQVRKALIADADAARR